MARSTSRGLHRKYRKHGSGWVSRASPAYNAGQGKVDSWIAADGNGKLTQSEIPFTETRTYVHNVVRLRGHYPHGVSQGTDLGACPRRMGASRDSRVVFGFPSNTFHDTVPSPPPTVVVSCHETAVSCLGCPATLFTTQGPRRPPTVCGQCHGSSAVARPTCDRVDNCHRSRANVPQRLRRAPRRCAIACSLNAALMPLVMVSLGSTSVMPTLSQAC